MAFYQKILLASLIFFTACKAQQVSKAISADRLTKKIEEKLGASPIRNNNFNDSYVLGWIEDKQSGTLVIRYGVWVIESGELLYANTAKRGSVKWLDNTSLLVEDYPGIIDGENQNFKFKIDLNTKIKTPLHEKEDL